MSLQKPKQTSLLDAMNDPLRGVTFYSAKMIKALPSEVDWITPQLIQRGTTVILVGPAKIGKTTFALSLANAISQGLDFLGHQCVRSRVLYICLEGGVESAKFKLELTPFSEDADIEVVDKKPFNQLSFAENLRLYVQRSRAEVVFIDSFILWAGKISENSYGDVYFYIGQLIEIAKDMGITIVFTHHSGKSPESSKDGCLGSTAWFGAPDTKIQLIEKKDGDYLKVDHRNAKSLDAVPIFINHDEGTISLDRPQLSNREIRIREKILTMFSQENSSEVSYQKIKEEVGGNREALQNTLDNLCAESLLIKSIGKGKGNPIIFSRPLSPLVAEEV